MALYCHYTLLVHSTCNLFIQMSQCDWTHKIVHTYNVKGSFRKENCNCTKECTHCYDNLIYAAIIAFAFPSFDVISKYNVMSNYSNILK